MERRDKERLREGNGVRWVKNAMEIRREKVRMRFRMESAQESRYDEGSFNFWRDCIMREEDSGRRKRGIVAGDRKRRGA